MLPLFFCKEWNDGANQDFVENTDEIKEIIEQMDGKLEDRVFEKFRLSATALNRAMQEVNQCALAVDPTQSS